MPKPPIYHAREQEVLDKPDGFRIFVTQERQRIEAPYVYNAEDALMVFKRLKDAHYRVQVYAMRMIGEEENREERLASITEAHLHSIVMLENENNK